jgi:hypothetical protein
MVTFHAEIPYAEAERRGAIQQEILTRAIGDRTSLDDFDAAALDREIHDRLERLG